MGIIIVLPWKDNNWIPYNYTASLTIIIHLKSSDTIIEYTDKFFMNLDITDNFPPIKVVGVTLDANGGNLDTKNQFWKGS